MANNAPLPVTGLAATGMHEARQVLRLDESPDKQAIVTSHRSLLGRFHPDKGGNDNLATKLNSARD